MSAWGQKQTFAVQKGTSALPPKADMCTALAHVCFGPIADIGPKFASPHKIKNRRLRAAYSPFRRLQLPPPHQYLRQSPASYPAL